MSVAQDVILHNCTNSRELSQYIWGLYKNSKLWDTPSLLGFEPRSTSAHIVRPCPAGIRLIKSKAMPVLRVKSIPASPRASHYKAKEIEKVLSKLNFSYLFHFALLHFSRVLPAGIEPATAP